MPLPPIALYLIILFGVLLFFAFTWQAYADYKTKYPSSSTIKTIFKSLGMAVILLLILLSIVASRALQRGGQKTFNTFEQDIANKLNPTPPKTESAYYTNTDFHFSVNPGYYTKNPATKVEIPTIKNSTGRIGHVTFTPTSKSTVVINVYENQARLEDDFSSGGSSTMESSLTSLGLTKTIVTLNDKPWTIFYGNRIADIPGGGKAVPYVAAEIVGSIYAYMIEFESVSTVYNDVHIMQYLNSFRAN